VNSRIQKKIIITIAVAGFAVLSGAGIIAQADNTSKPVALKTSVTDDRFYVKNMSFYKRLSTSGFGQDLNISFEIVNRTQNTLKLKYFMVAFQRVDQVDRNFRKWIPYPQWRERDPDMEDKINILLDSIPAIEKSQVNAEYKDTKLYPEFDDYVVYMNSNPDVGEPIVVQGLNSQDVNGTHPNAYYVTEAMKTTVFATLRTSFQDDQSNFFNYYGLVIVDPETKKMVYSQLIHFTGNFKIY